MFEIVILVILFCGVIAQNDTNGVQRQGRKFPPGFLFGAGSSAVQYEGAWNEDGKGISGWDVYQHKPGVVGDSSTSNIACDSYHLYKNDIPYLTMAGMNAYRVSLSWPRLLPTGTPNNVNQKGVDYYNDLINELLSHNINPVVTIFHFDLPLNYSKLGGFANEYVVNAFVDYAEFVLKTFGDRVKYWLTVNELNRYCLMAYGGTGIDPGVNMPGTADYLCVHYTLLAHAQIYRMFKIMPNTIKAGAVMGLSVGYTTQYPWNTINILDYEAADLESEFMQGWIINPVFGTGDYPPIMRDIVDIKSFNEGLKESRLPRFTPEQIALVKGSADFMSINHYTGYFDSFTNQCPDDPEYFRTVDSGVYSCRKPGYNMTYDDFIQIVPGSLKTALANIRDEYNNPLVLVGENGYLEGPGENLTYNPERQSFYEDIIGEVLDSIADGSKLMGYLTWSLLDDFEWNAGYTFKFGMVHVDFTDPRRRRTPKPIINFFKNVAEYGLNATTSS